MFGNAWKILLWKNDSRRLSRLFKNQNHTKSIMLMQKILRKILLLILLATGSMLSACSAEDTRSVTVVGYNYTERPLFFSVNGAGDHLFRGEGGGGFSCCTSITIGKPVEIKWTYSRTKKQYEAGLQVEHRTVAVIAPAPEVPEAEYLEVHFYPDHHVELALVKFPNKYPRIPYPPQDD